MSNLIPAENTKSNQTQKANNQSNASKTLSTYEVGYIPPFWSSYPKHKFSLDVWREGTIDGNLDLTSKEFYLLGRNRDVCDIPVSEEITVSRFHCVLQHKDDGDVFLYDLDSVYGTFLNKKPIAKKTYTKLSVGDMFSLGKSKKMFILNGPAKEEIDEDVEYKPLPKLIDRQSLKEKRIEKIKEQHEKKLAYDRDRHLESSKEGAGCNWGMKDYDDEIYEHERIEAEEELEREKNAESYLGKLDLDEIRNRKDLTEKQRSMVDKMDTLTAKIEKLKEDVLRSKKKEIGDADDLSNNIQLNKARGNEKRLQDLMDKYETQEDSLRVSLTAKDGLNKEVRFDKQVLKEINSDDDEFFDRTHGEKALSKEQHQSGPITENYETLKQRLENLIRNRQKLLDRSQKLESGVFDREAGEDTLDNFMKDNFNELNVNVKSKMLEQVSEMSKEIAKTQKLISLVTPSFIKIKYKPGEAITSNEKTIKQKQEKETGKGNKAIKLVGRYNEEKGELAESENEGENDNESDENELAEGDKRGFVRDIETLNQNKKKVNVFDELNKRVSKLNKKAGAVKFTDSDEEIINEVEMYKEQIGLEVRDAIADKREAFRKMAEEQKIKEEKKQTETKQQYGLIKGGLSIKQNGDKTFFNEIVNNMNTTYDPNKYTEMNKIIKQKQDEKRENKITKDIDYNTGGLQTFSGDNERYSKEQVIDQGEIEEDLDFDNSNFTHKKRHRIVIEPKAKPKVYSAMAKPPNRNEFDYNEDAADFDNIPDMYTEIYDLSQSKATKVKKSDNVYDD